MSTKKKKQKAPTPKKTPAAKHQRASGKTPSTLVFSARLKEERVARSLTQAELAEGVGITISYVSMLENATRSPTLDTIDALADALKVRPATLLEKK